MFSKSFIYLLPFIIIQRNTKMHKLLALSFILFVNTVVFSQKDYGKQLLDSLASDQFYGRGYVKNGDKIAANFIVKEFKKLDAQPIGSSFFQNYILPVNTFPNDVEVIINNKKLKTGEDFIISPYSGSAKGTYKLELIDEKQVTNIINTFDPENNLVEKDIAYLVNFEKVTDRKDRSKQEYLKQFLAQLAPVIVPDDEKFTWSVAREALPNPIIQVHSSFLKETKTITLNIQNKLVSSYQTQNAIGIIPAKRKCKRDKYIFFTAHYDHLGMMGENATFNGANDNASGTALMLSLMKHYSQKKPEYTMVFIAFGAEEAGLVGSKYFVEHPLVPLDKIKFLVNVDLMGTGENGVTVVNATEHEKEFEWLKKINKKKNLLKTVNPRGKAANSDHYWFEESGVPSFFIYAMGEPSHYHDINDRPETLPLTEFDDLQELIIRFVKKF